MATQPSESREKFRHSWDPRNRGISEAESHSCLCSTTLNIRNQAMSKHVSKTQKRSPNLQTNSSKVIGVSVDLDKNECGTVRGRAKRTEHGIALPETRTLKFEEASHPIFCCAEPFLKGVSSPREARRPFTSRVRLKQRQILFARFLVRRSVCLT